MAASRRLRVLVSSSTYPRWTGDPEPSFVHELSRRLAERFDVTVLAPHAAGARLTEQLDGVHIHRYRYAPSKWETLVNYGGILTNLRRSPWKWLLLPCFLGSQWFALRRMIRQFRPDVIHAHWLLPQGLVASGIAKEMPLLVTSHGADLFGLRGALFVWVRQAVIRRTSAMTVVSNAMQAKIAADSPGAHVEVMPMGVDAQGLFFPDDTERCGHELLFVGRLVEKKGLIHLIRAMPAIVATSPETVLTVIGFGPEQPSLASCAEELGLQSCVRFLGGMSQHELVQYYRRAALFVAPFVEAKGGDQEGLGLVVAEAMACECPVVVGDVPGARDVVDDACGVRVEARDHALLAETIVELLCDPKRRRGLAIAGRAHVLRRFDWPSVTNGYARLLETLACQR